jgi:hypothetical protein
MPTLVRTSPIVASLTPVVAVSAKGTWATVIADAKASANSAAELLQPLSITSNNIQPILLGLTSTSVLIRAKYATAITAMTTNPAVRIFAAYGTAVNDAGSFVNDGPVRLVRLDAAAGGTTGRTITLDGTNDIRDSVSKYSAPLVVTSPFSAVGDLAGAQYLIVVLETAAAISAGSGAIEIEAMVV